MRLTRFLSLIFFISMAASAEDVQHGESGYAVTTPAGWRAVAEYTHIDLLREKDVIHIYPSTKWRMTADEAFEDIAKYFSGQGARIGEKRTIRESDSNIVVWAPVESPRASFIAGVRRDERAWFTRVEPGDTSPAGIARQEAAFLEAVRTVRVVRDSDSARKLDRVDALYENERARLNRLVSAHAMAYSFVEMLSGVTRTLNFITEDDDLAMEIYETVADPAFMLDVSHWAALSPLHSNTLLDSLEKKLAEASSPVAVPNRASAGIARMILDEAETALKYSATTRDAIREARKNCATFVTANEMVNINQIFSRAGTRLDELDSRIRNKIIPTTRELLEKMNP